MILEGIIIASFLFFIFVWFYKQRRSELELLQVEFSQAATSLRELAQEKQPIIIRGVPQPPVLNSERLGQMNRLANFPLGSGETKSTLEAYRKSPAGVLPEWQAAGQPLLSEEGGAVLSSELALPLWIEKTLNEALLDLGALSFLITTESRVLFGGAGLERALGSFVCILPTEGIYTLSLVSPSSERFLPKVWEHRYPQGFTINDTPMVGEIKYIDVIVRPGTMVCVPAQTLYSLVPKDGAAFNAALILDVHSPVSRLAKLLSQA